MALDRTESLFTDHMLDPTGVLRGGLAAYTEIGEELGQHTVPLIVHTAVGDVLAALHGLREAFAVSVAAGETVDLPRLRRVLAQPLEYTASKSLSSKKP